MKFNSADFIENGYLLCGMPCIEFVIESELKNTIGSINPITMDSKIDIQSVNANYFFRMA